MKHILFREQYLSQEKAGEAAKVISQVLTTLAAIMTVYIRKEPGVVKKTAFEGGITWWCVARFTLDTSEEAVPGIKMAGHVYDDSNLITGFGLSDVRTTPKPE